MSPQLGLKWEILDIKLPEVPLVKSGKFHQTFTSKLIHALQQLGNYHRYFSRVDAKSELVKKLAFQPRNPKLALLIGRSLLLNSLKPLRMQIRRFQSLRSSSSHTMRYSKGTRCTSQRNGTGLRISPSAKSRACVPHNIESGTFRAVLPAWTFQNSTGSLSCLIEVIAVFDCRVDPNTYLD